MRRRFSLRPYREFFVGEVEAIAAVTGASEPNCRTVVQDIWTPLNESGLSEGPLFGGRPELVRIAAAIVRVVRPATVVETGVAEGVTTAALLDAMERNARGHLYSIDLPVLHVNEQKFVASLVPDRLRSRWTLELGPSRKLLLPLLARLGSIDVFLHDADHSYESQLEEYSTAWRFLRKGGILISDDVENPAFLEFASRHGVRPCLVGDAEGRSAVGLLRKTDGTQRVGGCS